LGATMKIWRVSRCCGFLYVVPVVVLCAALVGAARSPVAEAGSKARNALLSKHADHAIGCPGCHGKMKKQPVIQTAKCLECHGDAKALAERTAKVTPRNPHNSRHYGTEADCRLCHREHATSENFCLPCHERFEFKVP